MPENPELIQTAVSRLPELRYFGLLRFPHRSKIADCEAVPPVFCLLVFGKAVAAFWSPLLAVPARSLLVRPAWANAPVDAGRATNDMPTSAVKMTMHIFIAQPRSSREWSISDKPMSRQQVLVAMEEKGVRGVLPEAEIELECMSLGNLEQASGYAAKYNPQLDVFPRPIDRDDQSMVGSLPRKARGAALFRPDDRTNPPPATPSRRPCSTAAAATPGRSGGPGCNRSPIRAA
jgi:hypothetical protein